MSPKSFLILFGIVISISGFFLVSAQNQADDFCETVTTQDDFDVQTFCSEILAGFYNHNDTAVMISKDELGVLKQLCHEIVLEEAISQEHKFKRNAELYSRHANQAGDALPPLGLIQDLVNHNGLSKTTIVINEHCPIHRLLFQMTRKLMAQRILVNIRRSSNISIFESYSKTLFLVICFTDTELKSALQKVSTLEAFANQENIWIGYRQLGCDNISFQNHKIALSIKSQFYTANNCNDSFTVLSEVYQVAPHLPIKSQQFGYWSQETGLKLEQTNIWERRKDLRGVAISTVSKSDVPYIILDEKPSGSKVFDIGGYMGDVWKELQQVLGFNYTVTESIDGTFGGLQKDGTFNGMTGMVERNDVDVGISSFFLTKDRGFAVDFSKILVTAKVKVSIKRPNSNSDGGWMTFISPFTADLWICIAIMMAVGSIVIHLALHFSNAVNDNESSLFTCIRCLCQQGSPDDPDSNSFRIAFITVFYASLVLYSSYGAILTSFLAVSKTKSPFNSLDEMYSSTSYQLTTRGGGSIEGVFKKATSGVYKDIYDERFTSLDSVSEGLDRLTNEPKTAFVHQVATIIKESGRSCDFVFVGEPIMTGKIVILMSKAFPYTDLINYWLDKMEESGQLDKIWRLWKPTQPANCAALTEANSISFEKLKTAFLILGLAGTLAILILGFEKLHKQHKGHASANQNQHDTFTK